MKTQNTNILRLIGYLLGSIAMGVTVATVSAQALTNGGDGGLPRGGTMVGDAGGGGSIAGPLPGGTCAACNTTLDCAAGTQCFPTSLHCSSDQKACVPGAKAGDACQGGGTCKGVCGPYGDSPPDCGSATTCQYCDASPQGQCTYPESCSTQAGMKYCSISNLRCDQLGLGAQCAPTIAGAHAQDICKGTCRDGILPASSCDATCLAGLLCKSDAQCPGGTCASGVCQCPTTCTPGTGGCGCGDGILDPNGPDDLTGSSDDEACETTFFANKITKVIYDTSVPKKLQIFTVSDNGYITIGGTNNCLGCQIYGVCGDGFVDGTGTFGPKEQCDDAEIIGGKDGALSGDGCDTHCAWEKPTCTLAISGSVYSGQPVTFLYSVGNPARQDASTLFPLGDPNAVSPLLFPKAPFKGGSIVYTTGYSLPPTTGKAVMIVVHTGNTQLTSMCMVNFTIDYCGDGKTQMPYEQCDDGNTNNDDGCRNDCTSDLACTIAVQPTIVSSGDTVQITVKITKGYQNLLSLLLDFGDGTSEVFTPPFLPPPPEDVLEATHIYKTSGEFKPTAFLSGEVNGQQLAASCDCDCVVVTGDYKFWKEGVLSGSTIYWHIYGELPPTTKTFLVSDTLVGNSTFNTGSFDVQLGGKPYTLDANAHQFTLSGTTPSDSNFDIYFTSHAPKGGNEEICNSAELSFVFNGKTIVEQSDDYTHGKIDAPVCVSGYDLAIDKTILLSGEYDNLYKPEYNTYAPYAKEHGSVMTGNWYIYRVKVTNNGVGDAYDVVVDDTLPAGVIAFWMAPVQWIEGGTNPVTFTPKLPKATKFHRDIPVLLVNESKMIDLFVSLSTGAKYTRGEEFCNAAWADAPGDPNAPITDDACMTVSGACFRTCSGYVYADDNTFSRDMQGNELLVNATCIAKTTCGESTSFPADPARLAYDSVGVSLAVTDTTIGNVPARERGGGVHSITLPQSPQAKCGGDVSCMQQYITDAIEGYDAGNAYNNIQVTQISIDNGIITVELAVRVWKHRLTCALKTACNTELNRTYEITNFPGPLPAPAGKPLVAPMRTATKHGATVIGYPQTSNTHHYLSGCDLCGGGGGGGGGCSTDADCSDNNVCNGGEQCIDKECQPGTPLMCDDGQYCNGPETCNASLGCQSGAPIVCTDPDGTGCKTNACDESKDMCVIDTTNCGCKTDAECSDSNVCNGSEQCIAGNCKPGTPLVCDDGQYCNGQEICNTTLGCQPGSPVACVDPDGLGCKTAQCDESKDMCIDDSSNCGCTTDAECSDNNICNGAEMCVAGKCQKGTPLSCDNGLYCDGQETCDPSAGCKSGTPVSCPDPDGSGCKTNACDESKDMCVVDMSTCACTTNADCDDKNVCNGAEACVNNICKPGISLSCNDGQYCNGTERCDATKGCQAGTGVQCTDPDGPGCKTNACDENKDMCIIDSSQCGTYCGDGIKQSPNDKKKGGQKDDGYEQCDGQQGVGTGVICTTNCTCPVNTKTCPNSPICVPANRPCTALTKTMNTGALLSGDAVVYTITVSNPSQYTWYNLEVRDYLPSSLTGTFTPKQNKVTGQLYTWTGIKLDPGQSMSIVFSGKLICVGSGCVMPGTTMCNFAELWQGTGLVQSAQACAKILACTQDSHCAAGQTCDMQMCVNNSMCTNLSVVPPAGMAPLQTNYQCSGSGKQFTVTVADLSGKIISLLTGAQGQYTFGTIGAYTMTCSVDGDTGMKCYGVPVKIAEVKKLIDAVIIPLDAINTGYIGQIDWSGAKAVINPADYLDLSQDLFISKMSAALYQYLLSKLSGTLDPIKLATAKQIITDTVKAIVNGQCTEACRVPVNVGTGTYKACQAFTTTDPLYIKSKSGTVDFVCTPTPTFSGAVIEIHCNNSGLNTVYSGKAVDIGSGVYGLTGACMYSGFGQYMPACIIAGQSHPLCTQTVTLGGGGGGGGSNGGGGSHGGGGGSNGGGNGGGGGPLKPKLDEPVCSEIDPPAIQVGEYLPFRWDLEVSSEVDMQAKTCQDISSNKNIPGGSLYCNFAIFNGSSLDDPIIRLDRIPCIGDKWKEDGVRLFQDIPGVKGLSPLGKWYTKIPDASTKGIYGEYQIQLTSVEYERCTIDGSGAKISKGERAYGENDERICAMNFAVSDGFLLQQGATLSTTEGEQLVNYRYLDGRAVIGLRELSLLSDKKMATYQAGDIAYLMSTFVDRYATRAITDTTLSALGGVRLKKVSNAAIYVYDGGKDRTPLTLNNVIFSEKEAFTMIVRNADVIVQGSLKGKGMYVVPDGTVSFLHTSCDNQDRVEGMFLSPLGFRSDVIRNTNLFVSDWCTDGRLIVEGLLIGPVYEDSSFVKAKRSVLADWFDVSYAGQASKVFDAASVLIKANPKLWSTLPPGAGEFGAVLKIVK